MTVQAHAQHCIALGLTALARNALKPRLVHRAQQDGHPDLGEFLVSLEALNLKLAVSTSLPTARLRPGPEEPARRFIWPLVWAMRPSWTFWVRYRTYQNVRADFISCLWCVLSKDPFDLEDLEHLER